MADGGSGRDARDRARRDGRRPRARGDRRGRAARPRPSSTSTSCSPGRPTRSPRTLPDGDAAGGRRRCCRRPRSSRWTTSPRARSAPRRTRRSCAAPRPSATAGPQAMVGAGNTGATMAAALLRMGRIRGVQRPAIAVPLPVPGTRARAASCSTPARPSIPNPRGCVQWARLGREYAKVRLGVDEPTVALLSNGEEAGQGRRRSASDASALLSEREGLHRQRRRARPPARRGRRRSSPTGSPATSR